MASVTAGVSGLTGGRLRLAHVLDELAFTGGMEFYGANVLKRLQEGGRKILMEGERVATAAGVPVETKLFESFGDRLADLVAKDAVEWDADLIVLGTHGRRGLRRALLGSDAEQVARHATVPVLLLRPKGEP